MTSVDLRQAATLSMPGDVKLLLMALCHHAEPRTRLTSPRRKTLRQWCGLDRFYLDVSLRDLTASGYIECVTPRSEGQRAVYRLMDLTSERQPISNRSAATSARSARVRRIYLAWIADRDDYVCQLCFDLVDMSAPKATPEQFSPGYPTLDHVIPMAAGGGDEPENLVLAHLLCNIKKGALV